MTRAAKQTLALFVTLFYFFTLASAQSKKDSVSTLLDLSEKNMKINIREAEAQAQMAYKLAVRNGDNVGKAKALQNIGKACYFLNNAEDGLKALAEARSIYQSLGDSIQIGLVQNAIGNIYLQKLNQMSTALEYYNQAQQFLKNDSSKLIRTLGNIGTVHNRTGNYEQALKTYNIVYSVAKKHNDIDMISSSLNNIATVYTNQKKYREAIHYLEKAVAVAEIKQDVRQVSNVTNNIALAYKELKEYSKAKEVATKAIEVARACHCSDELTYSLLMLSDIHLRAGQLAEAERIALESYEVARKNNVTLQFRYVIEHLGNVYQELKELDKAIYYKEKLVRFNDSIAHEERKALVRLNMGKDNQTQSLTAKEEKSWMLLLPGLLITLSLAFVVSRFQKKNKRQLIKVETDTTVKEDAQAVQHLEVLSGEGLKLLNLDHVYWFQKADKDYFAHTADMQYRIRQNINALEEILPESKFFRVNRAVIVNIEKIHNYSFWENHKYVIRMADDNKTSFTITRSRLKEMKEKFKLVEKA